MNIKDAGRYANFLSASIKSLQGLFNQKDNYTTITENHLRSKANPNATDEVLVKEVDRVFNCKVNDIAYLIENIITEKLMLALAIETAKKNLTIGWTENGLQLTLDSAIEYNNMLRSLANGDTKKYPFSSGINTLANFKSTVIKNGARSFMINGEGNQVPYNYDVETEIKLDYDKTVVSDLYKKILKKTDEISSLIDAATTKDVIVFEPKYDLHDSVEEIIAKFEANLDK